MGTVHIVGDELVALAAALRLARAGHNVTIISASPRWRETAERPLSPELGATLELPSAWRDLFAKSGRAMAAELADVGLDLVAEPDRQISYDGHLHADRKRCTNPHGPGPVRRPHRQQVA